MKLLLSTALLLNIFFQLSAQPVLPCCDAAQLINNILIEKNTFYQVGDFKVLGSPYLFGEDQAGTVYSGSAGVYNINVRYNVYTGFLETTMQKDKGPVSIDLENIDSFSLTASKEHLSDLKFINRNLFNPGKKGYLLVLRSGKNYSLYKLYRSNLVSPITLRSDWRQFELAYDFYYYNAASQKFKLLHPAASYLKKEFGNRLDIESFVKQNSALSAEPLLTLLFSKLNQ
jgi:hypothetical protein